MSDASDKPVLTTKAGVALGGYDPMSYFDGTPRKGSRAITAAYAGATYHFATEANRAKFRANPDAFAPAYGGHCATAMSEGKLVPANPKRWKITDGRLFVFYKTLFADTLPEWVADEANRMQAADGHWGRGSFK